MRGGDEPWSWAGVNATTGVRPNPICRMPQQAIQTDPIHSIGVALPGQGIQPWYLPAYGLI